MKHSRYIWQHQDWPKFRWDRQAIEDSVYAYVAEASRLLGEARHLSREEKTEAVVDLMVSEAVKTSQIEGENLDREDVRSSIRNQLGLNVPAQKGCSPAAVGIAMLMASVRENFHRPLTAGRLCQWQDMVISEPLNRAVQETGRWRSGNVQIVSGPYGRQTVHYEGPPASRVPAEMKRFIAWFNGSRDNLRGTVRAGIAHLHFECIHPFSDGNGRVGRAIAETALAAELQSPVLMSLSDTIERRRKEYYAALERAGAGGMDITDWLVVFTDMVLQAQRQAGAIVGHALHKARFWDRHKSRLNGRQQRVVARMFRAGPQGFAGGMSAQKYVKITGCSKATATRDLAELLNMGALHRLEGGGRNTRYDIRGCAEDTLREKP